MVQVETAERRSKRGRPIKSKHPFPQAIEKLPGMTVEKWAAQHGLHHVTVKAWYAKGDGGRRIPRDIADMIEREFGIPATGGPKGTWKSGIR